MSEAPAHPRRVRAPQGGFSLLEVLFGGVVLSLAFLGHAASTLTEHRLSEAEQARSESHHVVRQFMERLRADDDWAGLYARLSSLQRVAEKEGTGGLRLGDGRRAFAPQIYYPDFVPVTRVRDLGVLVEVPQVQRDDGTTELRENADLPRFGLPADLSGDGAVDGAARDGDYRALPVVVTFRWTPRGETSEELRVSTWLRSDG